jgi:exosortase C (VPDSG-CTERM-specific)
MNDINPTVAEKAAPSSVAPRRRLTLDLPPPLIIGGLGLIACFGWPLYQWLRFALESDLYSYTLLVPIVSAYLFVVDRKSTATHAGASYRGLAIVLALAGLVTLGGFWFAKLSEVKLMQQDAVAFMTLPFVLLLAGVFTWGLRPGEFKSAAFPLTFLLFMVPFPVAMEHAIETFLQHGSAPPAYWLFNLVGTPVFKQDLVFTLPGITIQIAPECSGIRSTLVLFITSLLAGHLFLRSPWKRAVLTLVVIPLALARNGFRVFTIGQLCVSVGPHMIDSPIHHRGGPIFFALSLIPFFILVFFLVRSDRSKSKTKQPVS